MLASLLLLLCVALLEILLVEIVIDLAVFIDFLNHARVSVLAVLLPPCGNHLLKILRHVVLALILVNAVLLLQGLVERVLWVKVVHKLLQLLDLKFQCLGRFEVFALNGFLFALFEHVHVAANQLQLVSHIFQFDGCIKVFLVHCKLLFALQDDKFLLDFRV